MDRRDRAKLFGQEFNRAAIKFLLFLLGSSILTFYADWRRTVLLTQVNEIYRAILISAGGLTGLLVLAETRKFALPSATFNRVLHRHLGSTLIACLAVLFFAATGAVCGYEVASFSVEWYAFHSIDPARSDRVFVVEGVRRPALKSLEGPSRVLTFGDMSGMPPFSLDCGPQDCGFVRVGDRFDMMVETGRDGVERLTLPHDLSAHLVTPPRTGMAGP